jgi:hypothetical protein
MVAFARTGKQACACRHAPCGLEPRHFFPKNSQADDATRAIGLPVSLSYNTLPVLDDAFCMCSM